MRKNLFWLSVEIKQMNRVKVLMQPSRYPWFSPFLWKNKAVTGSLPEAWTSMMYWCRSWPCWMTSKVILFMASFRSVWRCSRCSARVRSSVLKSFICRSRSSFQASSSAVTYRRTTSASWVHRKLGESLEIPSLFTNQFLAQVPAVNLFIPQLHLSNNTLNWCFWRCSLGVYIYMEAAREQQ